MNIEHFPKIWLPRTGQVTSYAAGDDGYFQAGNPRTTRFIDNLNGTISDRATGLTWVKQPELIIPGATGVQTANQIQTAHGNWATGHAYALAELVADGDGSQSAALTIATITNANPGVATVAAGHNLSSGQIIVITGCTGGTFSTCNGTRTVTVVDSTTFTFGVNTTSLGTYTGNSGTARQVKFYVCSTAHTSGTFATDITAGKWRQTVWTASATNLTTPATMDWANAVANCLALEYAGFTDWRLPNILELITMVNAAATSGSSWPTIFPNSQATTYHSSTTYAPTTTIAIGVSFASTANGTWYQVPKNLAKYVRPVRGGRINA